MSSLAYIAKVFPPPRLMTLPSVGIDISESSLKYVRFQAQHFSRALTHWGDIPIPPGVITRGSITNPAGLAEVLTKVRIRCGTPYVRLSLPEERAYLFETEISHDVAEKDIQNLLEFRMEENVPLASRDAVLDYEVVTDATPQETLHMSVSVYAKETIEDYSEACATAKLVPLSFEVEADAIARAAIPFEETGVCMIIDLGRMRTGLGVIHRHTLLYTSTIDIGGQQFSDVLSRHLEEEDDAVLTQLKNERGLLHTGNPNDLYNVLLSVVTTLKDEIATRIGYWQTRNSGTERSIKKIILCGGGANMMGLPEYLSEMLGIPTERVDVWSNVPHPPDWVPPITRRYSYGYATAMGLALRDTLEQKKL